MYYYFSSTFPSAIKINGIFYGALYETVKHLRIDGNFCPLIEICPLKSSAKPINFILNSDFFCSPPDNTLITDLKGGYLIKFTGEGGDLEFSVVKQEKFDDLVVTVFNESGLKISIESTRDFFADSINFTIQSAEIKRFNINQNTFVAIFLVGKKNLLLVYEISNSIRKVFCREVDEFSADGSLFTTEKFTDMAKHVVKSTWEYENGCFVRKNVICNRNEDFNVDELNEKLIPYAFFEEFLACGDYTCFLTTEMKQHAEKLKGFLGDFIGIMPPPKFRDINQIGLIYYDGTNRYRAEYFITELSNGKICNIKKTDD